MKISVDWDRCTGIGMCEAVAPDLFEVGDDGQLQLMQGAEADVDVEALNAAIVACPTAALKGLTS